MKAFSTTLTLAALTLTAPALADRSSTHYRLEDESSKPGVTEVSSANYRASAELSGTQNLPQGSANYAAKSGTIGATLIPKSLALQSSDSEPDEGTTITLKTSAMLDDDTLLVIPAEEANWTILAGPVQPPNPAHEVVIPNVLSNTAATFKAVWRGFNQQLALTIRNTGSDDFGLLANDGLEDLWQVLHFDQNEDQMISVEEAALAHPDADPDLDKMINLNEFLTGTIPTDGDDKLSVRLTDISEQTVTFQGGPATPGLTYRLRFKPTLTADWQAIDSFVAQQQHAGQTFPLQHHNSPAHLGIYAVSAEKSAD